MTARSTLWGATTGLALVAGVVLVGSLFFEWYELRSSERSASLSGWQALDLSDAALVALAFGGIYAAVRQRVEVLVIFAGLAALVAVVTLATDISYVALVKAAGGQASVDRGIGVFVALAGAFVLAAAAATAWWERRIGGDTNR